MSERATPETDAFAKAMYKRGVDCHHDGREAIKHAEKLERERDEAREHLEAMERAGAEQARRADENHGWALRAERERDEALQEAEIWAAQVAESIRQVEASDTLYRKQCRQLEAMREAIKEAHDIFYDLVEHIDACDEEKLLACDNGSHPPSVFSVYGKYAKAALAKLQPFLEP